MTVIERGIDGYDDDLVSKELDIEPCETLKI